MGPENEQNQPDQALPPPPPPPPEPSETSPPPYTPPTDQVPPQPAPDLTQNQPAPNPITTSAPSEVINSGVKGSWSGFLKSRKVKIAALLAAVVIILGGGAAGAYYGIIVPNKPQNVLRASIKNLLEKQQISGKGHGTFTSTGNDSLKGTTTLDYKIQSDKSKNTFGGEFDFSYSGVKIPMELRYVDKALYLKFGDLSTLTGVISSFESLGVQDSSSIVKKLAEKVSGRWIEFDQSLLGTASQDKCSALTDQQQLSEGQINQLLDIYDKNLFVTIKNTSTDTVNGKSVAKYELGLDKAKAAEFSKELKKIDYIKKLEECGNSSDSSKAEDFKGTSSLVVWIDKSNKQLVKMQLTAKDNQSSTDLDFTFDNEPVNITKPDNSVPAMQIYSEIISLFSGSINSTAGQLPGSSTDSLFQ